MAELVNWFWTMQRVIEDEPGGSESPLGSAKVIRTMAVPLAGRMSMAPRWRS